MKNFIIVFLISASCFAQVNFKAAPYNAVGDGVTDDTAAIQAALDNELDLVADPGDVFLITSELDLDKSENQTIDWGGATMTTNSSALELRFINIDKPSGRVTMSNLNIDGATYASRGLIFETPVTLTNIDGSSLVDRGNILGGTYFIFGRIGNSNGLINQGSSTVTGCDYDNMISLANNNVVGDKKGATRGYSFFWKGIPNGNYTVTFKDARLSNFWGEDADVILANQPTNQSLSGNNSRLIFQNLDISLYARRGAKISGDNVTIKDCKFTASPLGNNDPNFPGSSNLGPAGFISFSTPGNLPEPMLFPVGYRLENTTFIGRNGGFNDSWDQVTFISTIDGVIENCVFQNGASLRFQDDLFNNSICNTIFGANSYINDISVDAGEPRGVLTIGNNNTFNNPNWNQLGPNSNIGQFVGTGYGNPANSIQFVDLNCTVSGSTCSDGIQNGNETGIDCGGSCPPCVVDPPSPTNTIKSKGDLLIHH